MTHARRYPKYKDSAVEEVGEVPAHWNVVRIACLGGLTKANGGSKEDNVGSGVPCVRYGDLYTTHNNCIRTSASFVAPETAAEYTPIQYGDVLFAASGETFEEIGKSAANLIAEQTYCGGDVIVLRPAIAADPLFLGYALDCSASRAQKAKMGRGFTVKHIYADQLRNLKLALPPLQEQRSIAKTLEVETARIEALIKKKAEFIDLLGKKRLALLTSAVTKGLNPTVKTRDSGVEWIGDVPAHWEVSRLGALFREVCRTGDQSLPVLSISIHDGITDEEITEEEMDRRVSRMEDRTKYKRVLPGDLAYNMMRAWQGAFGAVAVEGLVSPAYVVAEPTLELRTAYVEQLLRTPMAVEEMRRFSRGIADFRMRLYWDYFKDIKICLPPLHEQDEILGRIQRDVSRIEQLMSKTEESILLLRTRRSALITAAVTGKIDLREPA